MSTTNWQRLQIESPDLAQAVRRRFGANLHHVLGSIRRDGGPRLSGTEVRIDDDAVRLGMMARSAKLADVLRDPRVEIHSAPLEHDLAEGDVKLMGVLVPTGDVPDQEGTAFDLELHAVAHVTVTGDQLRIARWHHQTGPQVTTRR